MSVRIGRFARRRGGGITRTGADAPQGMMAVHQPGRLMRRGPGGVWHDSNQNPPDVNRFTSDSYGRAYKGLGLFKGIQWPIPVVGQGDSYDQPIPFAARQPALPPSCNSDLGFNCGFTVLLCRFRANLSDQRCLGRDGSSISSVQSRSVFDTQNNRG